MKVDGPNIHPSRNRICYKFFSSDETWDDARSHCQNLEAELASVTSKITNEFLTTLTQEECWIGGYKNGSTWQWTDGSESIWWKYRNWASGQPDNIGGNQDKLKFNFKEPGKWDNEESHMQQPFICQKHLGMLVLVKRITNKQDAKLKSANLDNEKPYLVRGGGALYF